MGVNVNCKFNVRVNECKHPKVERGLLGFGRRKCVKFRDPTTECLYYNPYAVIIPDQENNKYAEGVCPECGEFLVYNRAFEMDVECVDCGYSGKEWHKLEFVEHESVRENHGGINR